MAGNRYDYVATKMAEQEVLHPYYHVLFNPGAVQNESDITSVIITKLLLKTYLKKWGKKGK